MVHIRKRAIALVVLVILLIGSGLCPLTTIKAQSAKMPRIVQVSAGYGHALAVGVDGSLWSWGDNSTGELGDGTFISRTTPVQVGTEHNWVYAAAGDKFSAALKKDGSLWMWGTNNKNAYINYEPNVINRNTPSRFGKDNDWVKISAGDGGMAAIRKDGSLWQFGLNVLPGEISNGKLNNDKDWTEVSVGSSGLLALKKDGSLWGLGDIVPTTQGVEHLTRLSNDRDFDQIAASFYSVVRKKNGSVWTVNMDTSGDILLKEVEETGRAIQLSGEFASVILDSEGSVWKWDVGYDEYQMMQCPENMTFVDEGTTFGVALDEKGVPWTYGDNTWGQLGNGQSDSKYEPEVLNDDVADIVFADWIVYTLHKDGSLWIRNEYQGNTDKRLGMDHDWISIEGNREELYAIKRDGSLWTYRSGDRAPSGMRLSKTLALEPFQKGTYWQSVEVGTLGYAIGLRKDGSLWFWGRDSWQMLMKNSTRDQLYEPVKLSTNSTWQSFSLSDSSVIAIQKNGTLWGLGDNRLGQLGLSAKTSPKVTTLTKVGNYSDWVMAKIGDSAGVGIRKGGSLWQWGAGFSDGITYYSSSVPATLISKTKDWVNIWTTTGGAFDLRKDGSLYSWGDNDYGQLGNGTVQNLTKPTPVEGKGPWKNLFTTSHYTIGLKSDGSVWSWGNDGSENNNIHFVSQTVLTPVISN
ncbi:RCC1 domain-containing protein [Paenibacillus sp. sgz500958]|uniref:RCC1 domain-containing protein n=1 Tax=Paenibacillus sp. sgz500958 TaxID=3242475 RepID=UPI0036D299F7